MTPTATLLKRPDEVVLLRAACRVARLALDAGLAAVRPGVSTLEIDAIVEETLRRHGATPEFKGYHSYPAATCISVNEEVVHAIPGHRRLEEGDLVSLDVGARLDGWVGDNAATVGVGRLDASSQGLLTTTRECLERAIRACRPGARLTDLARAIQEHAEDRGYHVVRDYAGHGIGVRLHEEPQVPNYVDPRTVEADLELVSGLCIAIEPMLTAGDPEVQVREDGWTVVTVDGRRAAHFEDVVAVGPDGCEILTRP